MQNTNNAIDPTITNGSTGTTDSVQTNTGSTQPVVEQNVQTLAPAPQPAPQPGPDAAFAEMRKQNEQLQAQLKQAQAVTENPQVQAFLQAQEAQRQAAEAQRLGITPELSSELEQIKQWQAQQVEQQRYSQLQANEDSFKAKVGMDDASFEQFVGHIAQNHPEVSQLLMANPNLNLEPYLATYNPAVYAQFKTGAAQQQAVSQPKQAVYVPGHGNGASSDAQATADFQKMIAELAK